MDLEVDAVEVVVVAAALLLEVLVVLAVQVTEVSVDQVVLVALEV